MPSIFENASSNMAIAMRGNVVDLAIGVIIGAAFGAIVGSLVNDVIMPVIGAVTGGLDFSNYYTALSAKVQSGLSYADAKKQGAVLGWGQFLTVGLNFLIIAWVLFMTVKGINKLKKEEPPAPAGPTPEVKLLAEIRDLLKKWSVEFIGSDLFTGEQACP